MHLDIAQHILRLRNIKKHVFGDSVTIIYSVLDGSLAQKEGPPTFVCKSRECR